jgi:ParB family chromosome partitioning protein
MEIPVDRIRPNTLQPRGEINRTELDDLEASIREQGVLQPVLVRPAQDGYELVAGERRWRAAVAAGLSTVPAVVRPLDDLGALEAALVENLQREDLTAIDRARAYRRLTEEFGMTQEAVAKRVGRSQPSVANTLRLLSLPDEVQRSVDAGRISEGHARALLAVRDRQKLLSVWKAIEERGLSVRQTETAAKRLSISREIPAPSQFHRERQQIKNIELSISERIGAPTRVVSSRSGRGEIRISFFSPVDLDRLLVILGVQAPEPH